MANSLAYTADKKTQLIKQLIEANCVKLGEFKLKSGVISPYYVDLRESTMHPVFESIVDIMKSIIETNRHNKSLATSNQAAEKPVAVVGVPYGVVPLAGAVAHACKLFYYPVRKEIKEYGNKPDSSAYSNFEFILIEDVMSSGSSIIETIEKMNDKKVTDVIVVVDRESGGEDRIKSEYPDIKIHSIIKVSEILEVNRNNK